MLSILLFATFVAVEVTTGQWAHTYLTDARAVGDGAAAVAVAAFWGGLTTGRLLLAQRSVSRLVGRVGLPRFAVGTGALMVALIVLPVVLAAGVLALAGLALAPIIPSLFATTSARVGAAHSPRMSAVQLLAANAGAIGAPTTTGVLVARVGPGVVMAVAIVLAAIGAPLLRAAGRLPSLST